MGSPSYIGFGYQPFGYSNGGSPFQTSPYPYLMEVGFGFGDWAEETTWRVLPAWVRDEDGYRSAVAEPLRGYIDAIKPLFNEFINKSRNITTLWDALAIPLEQLPTLAYSVGVVLDETKDERLQRAEVFNIAQLVLHKGTDLGYSILAAFEDLTVEAIPLWENGTPSPDGPTEFEPYFDEIPADMLPLDSVYDNAYAIWPYTLHYKDIYRTNLLRLIFYPTDDPQQDFDPDVVTRLVSRLLRYKPIHIIIDRVTFDGLRGSSQTWTQTINADNAAAGMWVQTVTGEVRASSQAWVVPSMTILPP